MRLRSTLKPLVSIGPEKFEMHPVARLALANQRAVVTQTKRPPPHVFLCIPPLVFSIKELNYFQIVIVIVVHGSDKTSVETT